MEILLILLIFAWMWLVSIGGDDPSPPYITHRERKKQVARSTHTGTSDLTEIPTITPELKERLRGQGNISRKGL